MRLLYKHEHDGVWFSKNGHRAFVNGEKPKFMWHDDAVLVQTVRHHIARSKGFADVNDYTREYVMFFRAATAADREVKPKKDERWIAPFNELLT